MWLQPEPHFSKSWFMSGGQQDLIERAMTRLAELDAEIGPLETERQRLRAFVNQACVFSGREPLFPEEAEQPTPALPTPSVRQQPGIRAPAPQVYPKTQLQIEPDQFFGQGLATAARAYLEARKASTGTGPASADDIYDALIRGGFQFPSRDIENQKRGLQVSLSKNTIVFRKLPNEMYGLTEWYPANAGRLLRVAVPKKRKTRFLKHPVRKLKPAATTTSSSNGDQKE